MAKDISRNASASIFGWQFQINVAIYLMFKYFKEFSELKVEGEKEDIEIVLKNKNKIYAQAKSKKDINGDTKSYTGKLKDALSSLSDVKNSNAEKLMYISNLEPNPLNSGTKEFEELEAFLFYNELKEESKQKIDAQLKSLGKKIDKTKLVIAKVPFAGEDKTNKQKYIIRQLDKFLAYTQPELMSFSGKMLDMWESCFMNNATCNNPKITIKRDDILWSLLIFELEKSCSNCYDESLKIDEEQFQNAIEKYDKVICHKEGKFKVYNRITLLWKEEKNNSIKISDFINNNEEKIYNIVFEEDEDNNEDNNDKMINLICSKIVAKRIALRNSSLNKMFRKADEYEN
jgi:hypothetical protein